MKQLIIQSKGGAGKSYLTKLLSLLADKEKKEKFFIDCDNSSASTTKFFSGIKDRKSSYVKFSNFNLLGSDRKIDRTKFDSFLAEIEKLENVVADFGATSSDQLFFYMLEEQKNGIIQTFTEMDIQLLLVVAGGGSAKECVEFFNLANKIPGIGEITHLIANEFQGGINGKSVKEYTNSKVQIGKLHDDPNSEAQREWDKLMIDGVVYSDILKLSALRRRRIVNYLDDIFNQINSL